MRGHLKKKMAENSQPKWIWIFEVTIAHTNTAMFSGKGVAVKEFMEVYHSFMKYDYSRHVDSGDSWLVSEMVGTKIVHIVNLLT